MYTCFILYHFVALTLVYAMSKEFFNFKVLVSCYSIVNIHMYTHIWLTLSNIPYSVLV